MLVIQGVVHVCQVLILLWFARQSDKHAIEANVISRENAANMTRIASEALEMSTKKRTNTEMILLLMIIAVIILFCFTVPAMERRDDKLASTKKKPEQAGDPPVLSENNK